ncbi:MAG: ROK family protein [Ilumatobacteraceae bacterium]
MSDCFLAIDVGSSKLSAAVVDQHGEILVRDRVPTPARDVWPALSRLAKRVMAAAPTPPRGCGIGIGGPIDVSRDTVAPLHIPALHDVPLRTMVEELTGLPTVIDHSAKAVAMGEAWRGAAVGESNFVALVMGTTIAGGIFLGGRLLGGRLGNAGAIGHMIVESGGRPCVCGALGCLEAYCGGQALEAETGRPPQRAPQAIVERTGILVGRALASVGAVCDLRLAVVGGAVALGFGDPFFAAVQQELDQRAKLGFTAGFRVAPSQLGLVAPLVGAAALARRAVGVAQ